MKRPTCLKSTCVLETPLSLTQACLTQFSAGMGIALHYFGVAEPVYHLNQSVQHIDRYDILRNQTTNIP